MQAPPIGSGSLVGNHHEISSSEQPENLQKIARVFGLHLQSLSQEGANQHCFMHIFEAVERGEWTKLNTIVEEAGTLRDKEGNTLLIQALHRRNITVVQGLLTHQISFNERDLKSNTPLHIAAEARYLDGVRVLLDHGADLFETNSKGITPLDLSFEIEEKISVSNNNSPALSIDQLADDYYKTFLDARSQQDIPTQVHSLEKLGDIPLSKSQYSQALKFYNAALALEKSESYSAYLFKKLEQVEMLFLTRECNAKPQSCTGYTRSHRQALVKIRERASEMLESDRPIEEILKFVTQAYKNRFSLIVFEAVEALGEPPTSYALMGLGSMARGEMCPYSDLEYAILIKEENLTTLGYFRLLSQLLELKIINIGETGFEPTSGITPSGFSLDSGGNTPQGIPNLYELIATPSRLARFQQLPFGNDCFIMANAMSHGCYLLGDQSLIKEYQIKVQKVLDERTESFGLIGSRVRHERSLFLLQDHIDDFKPDLSNTKERERGFGVKRELYRPFQAILGALRLYYGFQTTSTMETIKSLESKRIISHEGAQRLCNVMRKVFTLRLQAHLFYHDEKEILYHPKVGQLTDEEAVGLFPISDDQANTLIEIYKSLFPFHEAAKDFVENKGKGSLFVKNPFYGEDFATQGQAFDKLVQYDQAEEAFQQALSLNPNNIKALADLAHIRRTLGNAKDAIIYLEERLRILKDSPKQNSEDMAMTLGNLGGAWEDLGEADKAIEYYEQDLAMTKQIYGQKPHPSVAITLCNLGWDWDGLGEASKAIEYFEESLAMKKQIYGEKTHPDVATTLNNLGLAWEGLGQASKAIEYCEQSLAIYKQIYGQKPHLSVATTLNNLALAWDALGEASKAIEYYEQSLAMNKQIYGQKPHPFVATTLNNLGEAWKDLGETSKAIEYLEQSLAMNKQIYGQKPHLSVARTLNNLGLAWDALGEASKAIKYYEQSLAMNKQIYGQKPHLSVATTLNNLGLAWKNLGEASKAIKYYEQSLAVNKQIYGQKPHSEIATTLNNLGTAWEALGEASNAIEYFSRSYQMLLETVGPDHPNTQIVKESLDALTKKL
ncbi:MAG: Photosystem I assembly protein Ycf3 [Chlamydiae bacterium]|nr:Photosystem I assembly protein Ycf3 [Chlamydiota bacterium]